MCGIAGFIGESRNPHLSHKLITALLEKCEVRGDDASGFWGTESGLKGEIVYHKEPIKATDFTRKEMWLGLGEYALNLFISHARGASQGVGLPSNNQNNHPFVNSDRTISLVHNGRIPDSEYDPLAKKYEVQSKCDSEILLRIFEGRRPVAEPSAESADPVLDARLAGLSDIWSFIDKGHMAVAIGERLPEGGRRLYLFRNKHRPLWLVDLREELGQIFFVSTPEIWADAFKSNKSFGKMLKGKIKLSELPTEELWLLEINKENPVVNAKTLRKYTIQTKGKSLWKPEGEQVKIAKVPPTTTVFTGLNEDDTVCAKKAIGFQTVGGVQPNAKSNWNKVENGGSMTHRGVVHHPLIPVTPSSSASLVVTPHTPHVSSGKGAGSAPTVTDALKESIKHPYYEYEEDEISFNPASNIPLKPEELTLANELKLTADNIHGAIGEIHQVVEKYIVQGKLTQKRFDMIIQNLDSIHLDLQGTLQIITSGSK